MNKTLNLIFIIVILISCNNEPEPGTPVILEPESPVNVDLTEIPYNTLSEYNFFKAPFKDLNPELGVIPYEPINALFVDYAHKKRFFWIPKDTEISYQGDDKPFVFPEGSVIIKNFYYDNVLPNNETKIIETRLMIKKNGSWVFAEYVWNEEQTEAHLDLNGSFKEINWLHEGEERNISYRIPSETECFICHKIDESPSLIGLKPRNINTNFSYLDGTMNQIEKWRDLGLYNGNENSNTIEAIPNWKNTSLSKHVRMRAYLDINCAHCHSDNTHCSYTNIRLDWNSTENNSSIGICETISEPLPGYYYVIQPGNINRSAMYSRFTSIDPANMMPLLGRSTQHKEALELMEDWINEMPDCNE